MRKTGKASYDHHGWKIERVALPRGAELYTWHVTSPAGTEVPVDFRTQHNAAAWVDEALETGEATKYLPEPVPDTDQTPLTT